ncbi:hypothetical protein GRJ2_003215000 [Grus japonensis]|uniref:Uncharacterized protein n=1 Tax=Grus japonensis TaxID=30415 RepID=A0ABC9YBT6_GRUJA
MRKDFSRLPGEHIITWLLRCWDNGASSLELEGREAKQLGSLSREGGINKAIGKKAQALSLWRQLLSSVRERYPFSEDDSTPSSYANSLAVIDWKSEEAPAVDEVAGRLRQYEESLSSSLVLAVEKLSQDVQQLKEDISYSPPAQTRISAVRKDEKPYALFTDGSCCIVGKHRRWKAAVWSPTRRVAEAAEGQGESSQFAEVKAIQLALDLAESEKWPTLYLYTETWMVANALWGWLQQWKRNNWQRRGKPIWAAPLWQDIAARLEKLVVKVHHVDAHVPKSRAAEEHQNNQQVDQAAKIEVAQVDLDWQRKGELFIARWAHDTSGHQGRDATYRWARDRGVDLTMDAISQVIHQCETCTAMKHAKWLKPVWCGGRWLKYKYGEAWQIDYITLPQTHQGKHYVLTMVEATTGWLETYPVPHATARNTILALEKQVLW